MNNNESEIKVAVCCRTAYKSKEKIKKQKSQLQEYCNLKGYKVYKFYIDNGYSAHNLDRPGYKKMMKDLKKGKFNKIVVIGLSRLFRNIFYFDKFFKEIEKYNCDLEIVNAGIDTSETPGILFKRILMMLGQLEEEEVIKNRKQQKKKYKTHQHVKDLTRVKDNG